MSLCHPAQPWEFKSTQRTSQRCLWLPEGEIKGGGGEEERGDPRAGNSWSVGLGSKMGAVLTATEAAGELRGKGKQGWGTGLLCSVGKEKAGVRSGFLEGAVRSADLLEATEGEAAVFPWPA